MCTLMFDELSCPDCKYVSDEYAANIAPAKEVFTCYWATSRRERPINCPYYREEWSGACRVMSRPCESCRRKREESRARVERWAEREENWREQNPLEHRVGEEIPEADRGWRPPFIIGETPPSQPS